MKYKREAVYYKYEGAYYSSPGVGCFATVRKIKKGMQRAGNWFDCRENFDKRFPRSRRFLFLNASQGRNCGERVAAFIKEVEKRLKIDEKTDIFGFKNTKNICCIEMSPWWTKNRARRQLFTILLRCGIHYTDNFNKALFSDSDGYMRDTEEAVGKFFNGYTHFKGKMTAGKGWVSHFGRGENDNGFGFNVEEELEKLVKPKNE